MKRENVWKLCAVSLVFFVCGASVVLAVPTNGNFSLGLDSWTVEWGTVTDGGGYALFQEGADLSSTLSQVFTLGVNSSILSFDVFMTDNSGGNVTPLPWSDVFTASLLTPDSFDPLVSIPGVTDFYYLDRSGYQETVADDVTGGTVSLDVSAWAGQAVLLSFDFFGDNNGFITSVMLDNVNVSIITSEVPVPGALLLGLVGSGLIGFWRRSIFAA